MFCKALKQAEKKIAQLSEEREAQDVTTRTQSAPSSSLSNGMAQTTQFEAERQSYIAQIQKLQEQCRVLEATVAAERQKGRGRGVGGLGRKEGEKGASSPDFNTLFGRWVTDLVLAIEDTVTCTNCTICCHYIVAHPPLLSPPPAPHRTESANKPSQHMASMVSFKLSSSTSNLETPGGLSTAGELKRQLAEAGQRYQEASRENGEVRAQLGTSSSSAAPSTFRGLGGAEETRQELQVAEERVGHVTVM